MMAADVFNGTEGQTKLEVTKRCVLGMLKLLKPGMDSLGVATFATEGEVLSKMEFVESESPKSNITDALEALYPSGEL